jgi:hypothetical protein
VVRLLKEIVGNLSEIEYIFPEKRRGLITVYIFHMNVMFGFIDSSAFFGPLLEGPLFMYLLHAHLPFEDETSVV